MNPKTEKIIIRAVTVIIIVAVLVCVLWIMAFRLGLAEKYDFGAGAYYYADIPDYDKVIGDSSYKPPIPFWIYLLLFLGWGWIMWRIWSLMERKK